LFKVDERVLVPKFALNFLPRDELAGSADEERQELERLRLEAKVRLSFVKVARANVQFEGAESDSAV